MIGITFYSNLLEMLKLYSLILPLTLLLSGCFEKETQCTINGLAIDDNMMGLEREQVIAKLGQPHRSALSIKGFDDYRYTIDGKNFAVILHYENRNAHYYVTSCKCIKAKAKFEIANHVIWH